MFNSEFKESTAVEITLEGKRAADVAEFLKCFYPNMKHNITGILNCLPKLLSKEIIWHIHVRKACMYSAITPSQ